MLWERRLQWLLEWALRWKGVTSPAAPPTSKRRRWTTPRSTRKKRRTGTFLLSWCWLSPEWKTRVLFLFFYPLARTSPLPGALGCKLWIRCVLAQQQRQLSSVIWPQLDRVPAICSRSSCAAHHPTAEPQSRLLVVSQQRRVHARARVCCSAPPVTHCSNLLHCMAIKSNAAWLFLRLVPHWIHLFPLSIHCTDRSQTCCYTLGCSPLNVTCCIHAMRD